MECREFSEIADSYLSDELTVECNHEALSHLEQCANCRGELSARRAVRARLREAFISSADNRMRPQFVSALSDTLRISAIDARSERSRRYFPFAVAACLALATLIAAVAVRYLPTQSPVTIVKTELVQAAVGDHRDCAVKFRLAEKPIELELASRTYDPVYADLTKSIFREGDVAPLGVQFVEAHSCVFKGRRFAHVVLRYRGSLVSFLVTDIPHTGEVTFMRSPASQEPATILCSQIDGYNVSFFQTTRHAIFVVSALPEGENLAVTRALAPRVFEHISSRERTS
jgi:anti-sigma factor RsiW